MKSIYKFIHVFIGLILFLGIGYTLQNLNEFIEFKPTDISKSIEKDTSQFSKPEKIETTTKVPNQETLDNKVDSTTKDVEETSAIDNLYKTTTEAEEKKAEIYILNYEMEPIDHHSIEHLYSMIEIIDKYKLSPHIDNKTLYNHLYTKNFVHFKKELSKKNVEVHDVLSEQMVELSKVTDSDNIIITLDIIKEILKNLTEVE